jgi:hypothetical protein
MSDLKPTTESVDVVAEPHGWLPPIEVEKNSAKRVRASPPRIYSAPRRFDLPTIFVVTTAYSMLFALLSALGWPIVPVLWTAGFITMTGVCQAVLFGGQRPRMASVVSGVTTLSATLVVVWLVNGARRFPDSAMFGALAFNALFGALLGYVAGTIIGGVFLLSDLLRGRFGRPDNYS